jgi:hypothetical protein
MAAPPETGLAVYRGVIEDLPVMRDELKKS